MKMILGWFPLDKPWIAWMQGKSIMSDKAMFYEEKGCNANTADTIEELGMVEEKFHKENFRVNREMRDEILV